VAPVRVDREQLTGDSGMSLVEVLVTMVLMSVAMALFTAVALQMYRVQNDTVATANAQTQANQAFIRLDREIRYAAGISVPNTSYVEYLRTDQPSPTCVELWLDGGAGQLKLRTWVQGGTPTPNWTVLVSDVSATQPFTLLPAAAPYYYQRLQLQLTITPSGSTQTKALSTTFTALNTSLATSSDTVCTEGRQVP
jgi:prepilin-type N-terminal cleavage/methylation domain-containing protein